jgi:hypothetical protein
VVAALLALALAAAPSSPDLLRPAERERGGGGDACLAQDGRGRTFAVCFDPGNRLELSAAGTGGRDEPARGGALEVGTALRWRRDLRAPEGTLEWMLDQAFVDGRVLFSGGSGDPRAASGTLWRGTFLRHRQEPFLFVPGPRPRRVPFPFDVGLLVDFGGVDWDARHPRDLRLLPLRAALLLDVAGHGTLRRLSFGPEVAWGVEVYEHRATVHELAPFTAGVLDLRVEAPGGLTALSLTVHGGSLVAVPGGARGFVEARLDLERVVVAVNDRPVALFVAAGGRGGARGRAAEVSAGVRVAVPR